MMSGKRTTETITADQWTIAIGRDCEVLFGRERVRNVIQQPDGMYHIYCEGHDTAYAVYSTAELTITWRASTPASEPTDAGRDGKYTLNDVGRIHPTLLREFLPKPDDAADAVTIEGAIAHLLYKCRDGEQGASVGQYAVWTVILANEQLKAENAALQRQLADLQSFYDMMVGLDYENEALEALNAEIPPFPDNQEAIQQVGNWADFSVLCEGLRESQAARRQALNAADTKAAL